MSVTHLYVLLSEVEGQATCMSVTHLYVLLSEVEGQATCMSVTHLYVLLSEVKGQPTCIMSVTQLHDFLSLNGSTVRYVLRDLHR